MMRASVAGALLLVGMAVLALPSASGSGTGHYLPRTGDGFHYAETVTLTNGSGNYTGYTEIGSYTGAIQITGTLPNGTDSATYAASGRWSNSVGQSYPWSESGAFTFSASTYHYVAGTDNQTGYTNPYVWFYMNSSAPAGSSFFILNTQMSVGSTSTPFSTSLSSTGAAAAIVATGGGSYQRNDAYGLFTANYHWTEYFDPTTGYVLGYVYTETDSDSAGNGFSWTDRLADSQTSFAVTPMTPSTGETPSTGGSYLSTLGLLLVVILVVLVVVIVLVVVLHRRSHRPPVELPRHPMTPEAAGVPWTPPPIDLIPRDQPVPQVVLRETVKVPCKFCGTLIDSTATNCPKCGAPRT